jgi:hypothetical protein
MRVRVSRLSLLAVLATTIVIGTACSGLTQRYEYEEEIYLRLDGSATVNVNASVASLVALKGADLPVDPKARLDRDRVRALFQMAGSPPPRLTLSRRDGRRFVHVSLEVPDVRQLQRHPMFAWSSYRFDRESDVFVYRQRVSGSPATPPTGIGWTGREQVVFKMHLPSEIPYHNAPSRKTERGNILRWEQPLTARLKGEPLDVEVRMESESILYSTLLLFGGTVVAALMTFALVIWWVVRRGRDDDVAPALSAFAEATADSPKLAQRRRSDRPST